MIATNPVNDVNVQGNVDPDEVLFVHSKCHESGWLLTRIDGVYQLGCCECSKPLGIELKDVKIVKDVIEYRPDNDDFVFLLPQSMRAWTLFVKQNGNAFLSCNKTEDIFVTMSMDLGGNWECDRCKQPDVNRNRGK